MVSLALPSFTFAFSRFKPSILSQEPPLLLHYAIIDQTTQGGATGVLRSKDVSGRKHSKERGSNCFALTYISDHREVVAMWSTAKNIHSGPAINSDGATGRI